MKVTSFLEPSADGVGVQRNCLALFIGELLDDSERRLRVEVYLLANDPTHLLATPVADDVRLTVAMTTTLLSTMASEPKSTPMTSPARQRDACPLLIRFSATLRNSIPKKALVFCLWYLRRILASDLGVAYLFFPSDRDYQCRSIRGRLLASTCSTNRESAMSAIV